MPTPQRPWFRRPLVLGVALASVAALVVAGLVWRSGGGPVQARIVEADTDRFVSGVSHSSTLSIPDARVTVETEVATRAFGGRADNLDAPRGGRLVVANLTLAHLRRESPRTTVANTQVRLRAGGQTVQLPVQTGSERRATLVHIPGDGSDLEVVVTFAGRTQSVRVADGRRTMGDFAPLYRGDASGYAPSMSVLMDRTQSAPNAAVEYDARQYWNLHRLPYIEGVGWAPAGREWVRVDNLRMQWFREPRQRSPRATFDSTAGASTVTVNGQRPTHGDPTAQGSADSVRSFYAAPDLIFSVPVGEGFDLHVRVPVTAVPDESNGVAVAAQNIVIERKVRYAAVLTPGGAA